MTVLAIDTSSRQRVVVVTATASGSLLDAEVLGGAAVLPALHRAVARLLDSDCEAVVVATGPGSYMGLRAGMAAGVGVAHARGLPLHGVGSLEVVAMAATGDAAEVLAIADAGRGGVYAARFKRPGGSPEAVSPPRRMPLAGVAVGGIPVISLDPLALSGVVGGDPALALARTVPAGLSRPALALAGLTASYSDDVLSAPSGPRVSSD